ncbi:acyl-CoA dehydrogenase family protein [Methylovirgula sp. 4M-Z18]|uniref:acyl-CoA dehydrogenase family protein n=1 Tax=Methylovirgula sp. 4M-Z18 TaxID=2293567 RepID=UPI000E2E44E7|nr:acyl-CoA dehydrogenase family protein [Methylovirgula sp. 4M-Z18]RFB78486.1 DNA alkylation response protein [Methylovirgula sp. 4M-Z18]
MEQLVSPNQSPLYQDRNFFDDNCALREQVGAAGVDAAKADLSRFGAAYGAAAMLDHGRLANIYPPVLHILDQRGERRDEVSFHPSYHVLMASSIAAGLHCSAWDGADGAAAHATRAARLFMATQTESGHMCPTTMTNASVAALRSEPEIARNWLPKICGRAYDPALRPWWEKGAVTLGMGMTERQGGTDVRSNVTSAARHGDFYEITGAKWFMSAPMCDAFLVLAQAPGGLSCFLVPRFRPDGARNAVHFVRLKDKLGNKSNASSEVEFHGAYAQRLGAEGEGIRTILEMVQLTRLDCLVSSAGLMRSGVAQAAHHARHRFAFQKRLIDQPLMRSVLADLALEVEAATALSLRVATAFDRAGTDPQEAAYARLITPAAKFAVCKAAPHFLYEAMECLGGNGYTEDWPLARLYREAPVNAIWEGSGNVMALDVLRALAKAPDAARELVKSLQEACGLEQALPFNPANEAHARAICDYLAKLAAAAALARRRPDLADAYVQTRLINPVGMQYGARDLSQREGKLIERILP